MCRYYKGLLRMLGDCKNCGKVFKYYASKQRGIYCSNKCQALFQVREAIESGNYTKNNAITYFKQTTEYKCSCCNISEWNGKSITLQIDHIDGQRTNNLIENLRYLCPNCHSQTDTWGVKNISPENRHKLKTNIGGILNKRKDV